MASLCPAQLEAVCFFKFVPPPQVGERAEKEKEQRTRKYKTIGHQKKKKGSTTETTKAWQKDPVPRTIRNNVARSPFLQRNVSEQGHKKIWQWRQNLWGEEHWSSLEIAMNIECHCNCSLRSKHYFFLFSLLILSCVFFFLQKLKETTVMFSLVVNFENNLQKRQVCLQQW